MTVAELAVLPQVECTATIMPILTTACPAAPDMERGTKRRRTLNCCGTPCIKAAPEICPASI